MSDSYIKPKSYYEDIYDVYTIRECLDMFYGLSEELDTKLEHLNMSKKEFQRQKDIALGITINAIKMSRFQKRGLWIDERMADDVKKQKIIDGVKPNSSLKCIICGGRLEIIDKSLTTDKNDERRVLFVYECKNPSCRKPCSYYDNGEKRQSKEKFCPNCGDRVKTTVTEKEEYVTVWKENCISCDYKNEDIDDDREFYKKLDRKEKESKTLLEKYRDKFCFSEKEGREAISAYEQMEVLMESFEKQKTKEDDPIYQRMKRMDIISLNEMKNILLKVSSDNQYSIPDFKTPDIGKYITVEFVVSDESVGRDPYKSEQVLKKKIIDALQNSNWRLMSEGLSYRLGILRGRIKGYEDEDEIYKLAKQLTNKTS